MIFMRTGLSVIFNSSTKGDAGLLGTKALDVAWILFGVEILFFIKGRAIKERRVLLQGIVVTIALALSFYLIVEIPVWVDSYNAQLLCFLVFQCLIPIIGAIWGTWLERTTGVGTKPINAMYTYVYPCLGRRDSHQSDRL